MKNERIFTVIKHYKGRETEIKRTLSDLIDYFSYTLQVSWLYDKSINRQPKTIKSFISNLNKAFAIKHGGFDTPYVELVE